MVDIESNKNGEKVPKRVIHFCDGAVPEYSTDEDDTNDCVETRTVPIDPASLNWSHWLRFKTVEIGTAALNVCDYLGDSLSSFLGITSPKYQFEIDHHNMMKQMGGVDCLVNVECKALILNSINSQKRVKYQIQKWGWSKQSEIKNPNQLCDIMHHKIEK